MTNKEIEEFYTKFLNSCSYTEFSQKILLKDVIATDAGEYVFWPVGNNGYYNERAILYIAAILNQRNKTWETTIENYFSGRGDNNPEQRESF